MDNKQDFDNNKTKSERSKSYHSRKSSNQHIPRKTINPAALTSSDSSGFAETTDNMVNTENISISEDDINNLNMDDHENSQYDSYQEYNFNSEESYSYDNIDQKENNPNNINSQDNLTNNPNAVYNENKSVQYPQRPKRRKKRSARLPIVLMLTTLIFTVAICLSILIIAVGRDMLAIGKGDSIKMITIEEGANAKTVSQLLEKEGIIDIAKAFEIVVKLSDADREFIPGQYELSPSDAYETIISILTTEAMDDDRETVSITFLEGESIYDAAKTLAEHNVCDAERFIYYFNAGGYGFDFETKLPTSTSSKFYRMEGYLFPDTYTFYVNSEPESVCMKIYQNFENKMTDKYYTQMQKMGMTLDEVITLASIVQAEAGNVESMKKVASVFENRLAHPDDFPKLQSDPTTYYVEEIIKPNIQVPSTAIFDAYDTYKGHGLPPGAIGNPGIDAIEAVLYPADTDYYFFAADIDTFEVYYAETLEEHEQNLAIINGQVSDDEEYYYDDYYEDDYYYE